MEALVKVLAFGAPGDVTLQSEALLRVVSSVGREVKVDEVAPATGGVDMVRVMPAVLHKFRLNR